MSVDVNKKIDEAEAAVKKYASKDTLISIGGYDFTPAKLMVAFTLVSSILGGLYGAFEVYKDYIGMKKKIAEYVTPDLTELNEKIAIVDKKVEGIEKNVNQATDYTNEIKNDLKSDIRRLENVVENVERSSKQNQRETDSNVKEVQRELRTAQKELDNSLKNIEKGVDNKIKKALDNPLNNK